MEEEQTVEIPIEGEPLIVEKGDEIQCVCEGGNKNYVLQELCGAVFEILKVTDNHLMVEVKSKSGDGPGCMVGDVKTIEKRYLTDAYFEKI